MNHFVGRICGALRRTQCLLCVAIAGMGCSVHAAQVDLESAARQFRIRTYQQFRTNRDEYDRRIHESVLLQRQVRGGKVSPSDAIQRLIDARSPLHPKPVADRAQTPTQPDRVSLEPPSVAPIPSGVLQLSPSQGVVTKQVPPTHSSTTSTDVTNTRTNAVSTPNPRTEVDLGVLSAKIESTNLLLETIDAQLHRDARLFPDELVAIADELESARQSHELSRTYLRLLPADQMGRTPELVPVEPIVDSFSRLLFKAQLRAHKLLADAGTPNLDHEKDIQTLRDLAHRVRTWQNH